MPSRQPSIYLTHGGGPLPLLGDPQHAGLVKWLKGYAKSLPELPLAIVVLSAHYEDSMFSITGDASPEMIYDYGGFPQEAYSFKYPAPGDPNLADKIFKLLNTAGCPAKIDLDRGFDHGVFVPLALAFPSATIPVVVVSQLNDYDPGKHWDMGRALRPLRDEGVLIIGSGSSYHNFAGFFGRLPAAKIVDDSTRFDTYIKEALQLTDPQARKSKILAWENAPCARECHPRGSDDHIIPLFGIVGTAHDDELGQAVFDGTLGDAKISAWEFQNTHTHRREF